MDEKDQLIDLLKTKLETAQNSERRLYTLIQSAPFCIHEINLSGHIISMNKSGLRMMEMQQEDEICGINYIDFVSNHQQEKIHELLKKAFRGEFSSFEFSPEKSELVFTSCFAPVFNSDGSIERVMGITEDITIERKNEKELLKTKKLESVGLLAGGIAHDFNNILTGLFGHLQLAALKLNPEHPSSLHIATANDAMKKASHLTNQLLTFAKGGDPLLEAVDVEILIKDSIALSLSGGEIKPHLILPDGLWHVDADAGQISQVISNLLINALQSMPQGGGIVIEAKNITLTSENDLQDVSKGMVCVSVVDQGVGISEEVLTKIFDPYFTTKASGTGLGLATVHRIIEKHGGFIKVESEVGKGTNINFYLNAIADKHSDVTIKTEKNSIPHKFSANILVMDDDEMVVDILSEILTSMTHTVDSAIDGQTAIKKYINAIEYGNPFDIVIMDLTIPGGFGGEQVIKELLDINPEVKAIVTSGYATSSVMSDPQKYGFVGYLIKPFSVECIKELISKIIAL
jgi:PAS domain S-box-containing protein